MKGLNLSVEYKLFSVVLLECEGVIIQPFLFRASIDCFFFSLFIYGVCAVPKLWK